MFELLFDALFAWNQLGMLMICSVLLGIGGAILGYVSYWRVKGVRIRGRIDSVYVTGEKTEKEQSKPLAPDKKPGKGAYIFLVGLPLIFCAIGGYMGWNFIHLKMSGLHTQAIVVRNESSYDSDNGTTYRAVLSFKDQAGYSHEVKDSIGVGGSPSFAEGEEIGIYYDQENPEHFVIDVFWHSMLLPIVFFAFGAAFIWLVLYVPNAGTTKGKKQKDFTGEMYRAVYSYQKPDGTLAEYIDDSSSNMIGNYILNKKVTLLLLPSSGKIHRPGLILPFIGLIFFGSGVFVAAMFVQQYAYNPFVFIFGGLGLAYIAFRINKAFSKIPLKDRKEIIQFFTAQGRTKLAEKYGDGSTSSDNPSSPKGRRLEHSEIMERLRAYDQQMRGGYYLGVILACGLLIGAYYAGEDMIERMKQSEKAKGVVVDLEQHYSNDSDGSGYTYYAVVQFPAASGKNIRFKDSIGSSTPMHKRGDNVDVLYMPKKPQDAIIDRGIWNWTLSTALAAFGAFFMFISARKLLFGRRENRYASHV